MGSIRIPAEQSKKHRSWTYDRRILAKFADWFAIAVAAALPWSTTFTYVFLALWIVALAGSWNIAERSREPWIPAGYLPAALWALGLLGVVWATVPLPERLAGLNSFHKLLAIPLFAIQFRDSHRGLRVLIAFLISCTVMLVVSWGLILMPDIPWRGRQRFGQSWMTTGIPVKDYNSQSTMFTLCILGLAEGALFAWRKRRRYLTLGLVLLAVLFFANILYAATSRTALVALSLLLVLFAFMRLGRKSAAGLMVAVAVVLAITWWTSPQLRERVTDTFDQVLNYQPNSANFTSTGGRLEFWRRSVTIIATKPLFGHGTGSIREQFHQTAVGQTGMAALETANPHNQILATAIQLGLFGTVVLLAMWIAHVLFFVTPGLPAGIGFAVVVQNIISSQFNSSLFDFTHGWVYVLGTGVLSGMVLRGGLNDKASPVPTD
jgi:O-antigen ligase